MKHLAEFTEETILEQKAYEHYKKVEAENYHLKRQLQNKNKDVKMLKHRIRVLENAEKKRNRKPNFRNGKRGTIKNGG